MSSYISGLAPLSIEEHRAICGDELHKGDPRLAPVQAWYFRHANGDIIPLLARVDTVSEPDGEEFFASIVSLLDFQFLSREHGQVARDYPNQQISPSLRLASWEYEESSAIHSVAFLVNDAELAAGLAEWSYFHLD